MNILCVDDDPINRRVLQAMLQRMTARVTEAVDGLGGIEALANDEFDVVLMDLRMPRMDGLSAIRHIRAGTDKASLVPIIVLTADVSEEVREDCAKVGADAVMHKPVNLRELCTTIGTVITRRAA